MTEIVRLILEAIALGRSRPALLARAAFAEDRACMLRERAKDNVHRNARKARRLFRRGEWWADRASVLRRRAEEGE